MAMPGISMKQTLSTVGGQDFNTKFEMDTDDEEEKFHDADQDNKETNTESQCEAKGWEHRSKKNSDIKKYDPWSRNPSYSGADNTTAWSLASYLNHFHPSVRNICEDIVNGSKKVTNV